MNLSKNFTLNEVIKSDTAVKNNIDNTPNLEEINNLELICKTIMQPIRDKYGKPIIITSGYRSKKLNDKIKGSKTSQHLTGSAIDFVASDGNNKELWDIIVSMIKNNEITVGQLINERKLSWIHISLPTKKHKNKIFSL